MPDDLLTWAKATAADGRAGPAKAVAEHLLQVIDRWRAKVRELERDREEQTRLAAQHQSSADACLAEVVRIEAMLDELCEPLEIARKPRGLVAAMNVEPVTGPETEMPAIDPAPNLAEIDLPTDTLEIQPFLRKQAPAEQAAE